MTEATSTAGPPVPTGRGNGPEATPPTGDRKLMRTVWILLIVTGVAIVGFGVFYYLSQRVDSGPTQVERVVATAEQAVRDNPNDVTARLALAGAYVKAARPDDATAQFQEILVADPTNRSALLGLGAMYYEKGELDAAKEQYTKVIESSGTGEFAGADVLLGEALYYRGMAALRQKDSAGAISDLEAAVQIDKADADSWYQLGKAQLLAGNPDKAVKAFDEALAFVPTGWCEPYDGLKTAYEQMKNAAGVSYATSVSAVCNGDTSEAQLKALEAAASGEFRVPALLELANAAESLGETATALKWYQEIVKADPNSISANAALTRLSTENPHSSTAPSATASTP